MSIASENRLCFYCLPPKHSAYYSANPKVAANKIKDIKTHWCSRIWPTTTYMQLFYVDSQASRRPKIDKTLKMYHRYILQTMGNDYYERIVCRIGRVASLSFAKCDIWLSVRPIFGHQKIDDIVWYLCKYQGCIGFIDGNRQTNLSLEIRYRITTMYYNQYRRTVANAVTRCNFAIIRLKRS